MALRVDVHLGKHVSCPHQPHQARLHDYLRHSSAVSGTLCLPLALFPDPHTLFPQEVSWRSWERPLFGVPQGRAQPLARIGWSGHSSLLLF